MSQELKHSADCGGQASGVRTPAGFRASVLAGGAVEAKGLGATGTNRSPVPPFPVSQRAIEIPSSKFEREHSILEQI